MCGRILTSLSAAESSRRCSTCAVSGMAHVLPLHQLHGREVDAYKRGTKGVHALCVFSRRVRSWSQAHIDASPQSGSLAAACLVGSKPW